MNFLHYNVIKQLGEGGMGKVYLAEDTMLEKKVALKVLSLELSRESQFIERFKREAKIQSKLSHPNITTLHNLLFSNNTYFIVMEYAEGITLQDLIQKTGPIIENRALKIFEQIYNALTYAHSKDIIHRDIKPANIMISENDEIKIMDFGIAKLLGERNLTKTNTKMGSLFYMSPEQINTPKDVDYRTDLFSLGIVLFEMLTGKLPYDIDTDSDFQIMNEIVSAQIPDPKIYYPYISENTVKLIYSLTNKDKELRKVGTLPKPVLVKQEIPVITKNDKTLISNSIESKPAILSTPESEKRDKFVKNSLVTISIAILLFIIALLIFQKDKEPIQNENKPIKYTSKVIDIDSNVYNTVTIGTQEWTAENLNVEHYRNGDIIPQVKYANEWSQLTTGAWCYYDNKVENGKIYGKLYNWYAVPDKRGIAPEGFHIPSDAEFIKLTDFLGGEEVTGGKLKSTTLWESPNTGATNESGLSALPGGDRGVLDFDAFGKFGCFWSSTSYDYSIAWSHDLFYNYSVKFHFKKLKLHGLSVRCVRD